MTKDLRPKGTPVAAETRPPNKQVKIRLDDSNMQNVYANVFNAGITREEIVLLFGMNQGPPFVRKELRIRLSDRIVLNPFAAKRLARVLNGAIREYEFRFGSLDVKGRGPESSTSH